MMTPPDTSSQDETQLPSDIEPTSYPTHNRDGKPVLGYDNGTQRPSSAPISSDTPTDAFPGSDAARKADARAMAEQTLQNMLGNSATPLLVLPAGIRFATTMVLSAIAERRLAHDKSGMQAAENITAADWLATIEGALIDAGQKLAEENLIDQLVEVAAITAAAIEHLQSKLDIAVTRREIVGGAQLVTGSRSHPDAEQSEA